MSYYTIARQLNICLHPKEEDFDTAIIGAGVVGLMVAYRLSAKQKRVCLIEKNEDAGMGVTSGQANVIHVVQLPFSSMKSKLARQGNLMYDKLCQELGVTLLRMPALLVVKGWSKVPLLFFAYLYLLTNLRGQFRTQLMRGPSLRKLEPSIARSVTAGLVVSGYGTVDVQSLVVKLKDALISRGVVLMFGCEVRGAEVGENSTLLRTSKADIKARYIVNSAGLYSDYVARMFGKDLGTLEPGLGVMAVFSGLNLKTLVAPLPISFGSRTKGGAIIPATDGTTIIGPTLRMTESKEENRYTEQDVNLLKQKFFPLLSATGELSRVYTGIRPLSPTKDFILDIDKEKRVVNLVGIESPGLTAAPALAELVEQAILGEAN